MDYIYIIENIVGNEINYKIGCTKNLNNRLKQLETGNPGMLNIIKYHKTKWGKKIEFTLHRMFKLDNIKNEWFKLDKKDINNFNNICNKIEKNFDILYELNNHFIKK
jgi:hypothetical protein